MYKLFHRGGKVYFDIPHPGLRAPTLIADCNTDTIHTNNLFNQLVEFVDDEYASESRTRFENSIKEPTVWWEWPVKRVKRVKPLSGKSSCPIL